MNNTNTGALWVMTTADVKAQADAILKGQGSAKSWGLREHITLLGNIAVEHGLPSTMKEKFESALRIQGLGANASQFRQWLEKSGVPITSKRKQMEKLLA